MLNAVEQAFTEFVAADIGLGDLAHGAVHGQVILASRDNQVDLLQNPVIVNLVFVEEGATRRFADANPELLVDFGAAAHMFIGNRRVGHQFGDLFQAEENFNQPRIVVMKAAGNGLAIGAKFAELGQFGVGACGAGKGTEVDPCEWPHPIHALGVIQGRAITAHRFTIVGEFQIAPRLDGLADDGAVIFRRNAILDNAPFAVHHAQNAVIMFQPAFGRHQAEEIRGKVAIALNFRGKAGQAIFEQLQTQLGTGKSFGQHRGDLGTGRLAQRIAHTAGHGPRRVDAAPAQQPNDLLPKVAQTNPPARDIGILFNQPHNVALRWVTFHAQQQVRATQMKKAERMALDQLGPIHHAAQLGGRGRNAHREQGIPRFGGGHQVAHGANATNTGRNTGHLPKGAPFAKFFKTAKLGHMKAGIGHLTLVIQLDGDFGMPFDPRDWVYSDSACHKESLLIIN